MKVLFLLTRQKDADEYALLTAAYDSLEVDCATVSAATRWDEMWERRVQAVGYVVLGLDPINLTAEFTAALQSSTQRNGVCVIALTAERLVWENEITEPKRRRFFQYFKYGGKVNRQYLVTALSNIEQDRDLPRPVEIPWQGVVVEDEVISLAEYCRRHLPATPSPTVLFLFHREQWLRGETQIIDALCAETKRQGAYPIALFCQFGAIPAERYEGVGAVFTQIAGGLPIDAVVTLQQQSMTGMEGFDPQVLLRAGVPVLQAYTLYTTEERWQQNPDGMGSAELGTQVILPEFDGVIHTNPVAALAQESGRERAYRPLAERIRMVVAKAIGWAKLRHVETAVKKVAIVLHNYPPKNSNIGSAAGLDTPASLYRLLREMEQEGYAVGGLPDSPEELMEMVLAVATNDRAWISESSLRLAQGKMSDATYIGYYQTFAASNQEELDAHWGNPPGDVLHFDDYLLIPGIAFGNIWVGVQPPRGFGENLSAVYHSPTLPPTHQYLAFYEWLRSGWCADAVIHLGTHGSMEWLPGKGTGLSETCYPDRSLRMIPDIYPYWITIVGEGIQAKRRGAACLIGHMSPPQEEAGLYGPYVQLARLVDEYRALAGRNAAPEELRQRIVAAASELDFSVPDGEDEAEWIGRLHDRLEDLMYLQIRIGLHVLGHVPQGDEISTYLSMLTNEPNGEVPSLLQTFMETCADADGTDSETRRARGRLLRDEWIQWLIAHDYDVTRAMQSEWAENNGVLPASVSELQTLAEYIRKHIVPALRHTVWELTHTVQALDGKYIEPSLGGAPTSGNADILPTGRNFTSADPRTFPTEQAMDVGAVLAEQALERFIQEEGRYPESIGIILWATAQMRTYGQCLGEIFALLGVRPIRQAGNGKIVGLEVIPTSALGRPRIDVTARISGLFRDTMPSAARWVQQATDIVAKLDESTEENYVRKHLLEDIADLKASGLGEEEAWICARWRVFGDPPGAYGAGVGSVLETQNWETKEDLASVYARWSSYAVQEDGPAMAAEQAFALRLRCMEVTIQNADNRESHLLNSDDYNAYHGGLNASVEVARGKAPLAVMGDSSRRSAPVTRTIAEETDRLIRAEALNPKFIEGMKKHGYKGAMELANYAAHLYQWDATSDVAEDWMYHRLAQTYAFDEEMQAWWKKVNPWALKRLTEVLLEAWQRKLWEAPAEDVRMLQELLLSMEGELEDVSQ